MSNLYGMNPTASLNRYGIGPEDPLQSLLVTNTQRAMPAELYGAGGPSFMQNMLGYTDGDGTQFGGWGGLALGALQGAGNLWTGMKQYGVAKDTLKQQRREFDANFGAQRNMINSQLEDRQRARVAANPGAHRPVDQYMSDYRVR